MSIAAVAWAKTQRTGSPTLKAVLMAVADYADEKGRAWPSQVRIAEDTELSERAVRNALAELVERGLISRESRHRPDGSRSSDIITMKLPSEGNRHDVPGVGQQVPGVGHDVPGGGAPRAGHELPLNHQRTESSNELSLGSVAWPRGWFDQFYDRYPRHQGRQDAAKAAKTVERMSGVTPEIVMSGLDRLLGSDPDPQFVPLPATWLRGRRWEDEAPQRRTPTTGPPGGPVPSQSSLWKARRTRSESLTNEPSNPVEVQFSPGSERGHGPSRGTLLEQDRGGAVRQIDDFGARRAFGR